MSRLENFGSLFNVQVWNTWLVVFFIVIQEVFKFLSPLLLISMGEGFDIGIQSLRPETPEPGSRQGRRNAQPGVQLLDDDGGISDQVKSISLQRVRGQNHLTTVQYSIFTPAGKMLEAHLWQVLCAFTTSQPHARQTSGSADPTRGCLPHPGGPRCLGTRYERRTILQRD